MQKIKVLVNESNIVYSFNPNVYVDSLRHVNEFAEVELLNTVDAWASTDILQSYIRDKQMFDQTAKDIFLIRQLLMTGYFRIDQEQEEEEVKEQNVEQSMKLIDKVTTKNKDEPVADLIRIRIDKVAIGTRFNIPANKDIEAKKITNQPYYNFSIDQSQVGLKRLLAKSEKLYNILLIKDYFPISDFKTANKLKTVVYPEIVFKALNETPNPFINLGDINKYLGKAYFTKSSELLDVFIDQLRTSSNLQIIRELVYGKFDRISDFIYNSEKQKSYNKRKDNNAKNVYESLNMFNRLYNTILKSPKSYEAIIDKIKANNIFTIEKLKHFLSKDEYAKVSKLVEVTIEPPNDCVHHSAFRKFYSSRNKEDYFSQYESLKNEYIKHIEADHVYRCKKCDGYLFCEHDMEFANAATVGLGLPSTVKEKLAEKYRDTSINDVHGTIFCKYCNGKLYRIQNDEIIDGSIFNALSHARSLDENNTTELPIAKNETYSAIKRVVSDFIFRYEYNASTLVKNIQKIILIHVLTGLGNMKLNAGDDNFEPYAQLLGAIYAYIYMYDLYARDKNISMRNVDEKAGQKLNINQYAKTFAEKILQQYNYVITDAKRLESMITNAYLIMKNEMRAYVDEITEVDHVLQIIDEPYYRFLHELFSIERMAEGKPELNEADSFVHIVKVQKPTLLNFLDGAYSPKSGLWKQELYKQFAEIYELLLDFASPYNYYQIQFDHQSSLFNYNGFVQKEFDPALRDKMFGLSKANNYALRRQQYLNCEFSPVPRSVFMAVPACYNFEIIDGKLQQYKWEPVLDKGKITDFISDKISLLKLKCDDALSQKVLNILAPDKRNTVIGKIKHKKESAKVVKESTKTRDIQFSVIKKINQGFNINQIKYIGQSTGVSMVEFMKGNVALPIPYELCCSRVNYYINRIIKKYNHLKYNPNSADNLHYFERANMITKVNNYTEDKFPDIGIDAINNYDSSNLQDLYEQYQEYIIDLIKKLLGTNDPIIRLFIVDEITKMLEIDKLYCIGDITNASNVVADDDDAVGNGDQAQEIDVDENDDDFVDVDNIDYEMDEDEIHD